MSSWSITTYWCSESSQYWEAHHPSSSWKLLTTPPYKNSLTLGSTYSKHQSGIDSYLPILPNVLSSIDFNDFMALFGRSNYDIFKQFTLLNFSYWCWGMSTQAIWPPLSTGCWNNLQDQETPIWGSSTEALNF